MRTYPDRIWLVLLGVAVAILVTLTTIFWNGQTELGRDQSGTGVKPAAKPSGQTILPRLAKKLVHNVQTSTLKRP